MTRLPRLTLLATGGTIAGEAASAADTRGYVAGARGPATLLAAVPGHEALAEVETRALMAIDSKDMCPRHWLEIARATAAELALADCDGVVITHGTDTLEETAFFLHLVLPPGKPVVLTAAMRPATALSADGPMNLYQAIAVAASAEAHGKGILVVMNDHVFAGCEVVKAHTGVLGAICAPDAGPLGRAVPVHFFRAAPIDSAGIVPIASLAAVAALPRVDILYAGAGSAPDLLAEAAERGAAGVVLALPGAGSLPGTWRDAARAARAAGVFVLRATRVPWGWVGPSAESDVQDRIPGSGRLSPPKARIALMLEVAGAITGLVARLAQC